MTYLRNSLAQHLTDRTLPDIQTNVGDKVERVIQDPAINAVRTHAYTATVTQHT